MKTRVAGCGMEIREADLVGFTLNSYTKTVVEMSSTENENPRTKLDYTKMKVSFVLSFAGKKTGRKRKGSMAAARLICRLEPMYAFTLRKSSLITNLQKTHETSICYQNFERRFISWKKIIMVGRIARLGMFHCGLTMMNHFTVQPVSTSKSARQ